MTQKPTTAAPTNDHRRTDVLTTDVPLIPQSVPLSSVQSLLDLARHSACRDAAQAIEDGNISAALAALDALTAGAFYWRGAVTNGFQQGFFVNALRGYCLERLGDIVKAYRAYQNSRAYFDDQAVAMQCPEPRLEVFLGLGRTCLVAARYTDAFNWLDLVRLEASADPRIAAAADRGLIRRAVEIGDYHDAITNYLDLQFQLAESEKSQDGDHSHTAVGGTGQASGRSRHGGRSQAEKSTSKFVRRERIYSPQQYTELAQLYFWTRQDRPGFKTVLDGITLLGIDNDLGVKDPMVDCFLNNIMRADDTEVQRFYDLLGYALAMSKPAKGEEAYIAFLCNARALTCALFNHVTRQDDLTLVRKRIDELKSKGISGYRQFKSARQDLAKKRQASSLAKFPFAADLSACATETKNDAGGATPLELYTSLRARESEHEWAALIYEEFKNSSQHKRGVSEVCDPQHAAAAMLVNELSRQIGGLTALYQMANDYLTTNELTSQNTRHTIAEYDTVDLITRALGALSNDLPRAHPVILDLIEAAATHNADTQSANVCYEEYLSRSGRIDSRLATQWIMSRLTHGDLADAANIAVRCLERCASHSDRVMLVFTSLPLLDCGNKDTLMHAQRIINSAFVGNYLGPNPWWNVSECFSRSLAFAHREVPSAMLIQDKLQAAAYVQVIEMLTNTPSHSLTVAKYLQMTLAHTALSNTDEAAASAREAVLILNRLTRGRIATASPCNASNIVFGLFYDSVADAHLLTKVTNVLLDTNKQTNLISQSTRIDEKH